MGEMDLEFVHRAGRDNTAADALSHHPTYYPEHADINADIQYLVYLDYHCAIPLLLSHIAYFC